MNRDKPTPVRLEDGDYRLEGYGTSLTLHRNAVPLVRINAPAFYENEGFLRWLNSSAAVPATWHPKGDIPGEYSDAFFYYGGASWGEDGFCAEGSDYPTDERRPGIPDDIYALVAEAVEQATGSMRNEALIWVSNLPE